MINEQLLAPIQNAKTNPTLEFLDGQARLKMKTLGGTTIERLISYEQIRAAALNIPIDSGWLGPEIVRWGNARGGEWTIAFIPPGRYELELTEGTPGPDEKLVRVTAPLPGMVMFGFSVKYFIWAVKTERCEPYQELYRCPLPNVMQDASICWGLLKPPQASPRSMMRAHEVFIRSTFNNHAASGKSKSKRDDVRDQLKALAVVHGQFDASANAWGEPWYPVEDLVRQVEGEGVTLDKAIRGFFESGEMPG